MEELATVTEISHGNITVVSQIKSTCNSCSQVNNCANGQVAKAIPHKKLSFTLGKPKSLNKQIIGVGDSVLLTVPEEDVLSSAWQVYLLPILGLFSFSALGQWLVQKAIIPHELIAIVIGSVGGYLGYRLAKKLQSDPIKQKNLQPKILRVLPKPLEVNNISES
ncbi:SoxR reducing system RseC family protein [Colwellia sp. 4_MG-2023]|jgi:sigma-E factor negative regulatory protein RseC|uniref:SoxR reducing system RseC family protein n=1 Tax=unclassified Colwellia TaxID=196834 RepID=UPI002090B7BF|nr:MULTISPECIES: SoxR reducing system RseC family protein [unclassified Colwellia]MDO6486639.1 SoxR reducing system RseC family protein [Colwellia sp. 6_MG-2023]MDO6506709.1 SoxR reducing system RseC family protein [Colwellia sp. 5_MG-2023]MDO6555535.1 SoxR reducing system RseC family protein [Colwellia sp. 4_MG-2023]MDO6651334.1 SoxR reducing system RseC family protein [Colwellia sp. 3_MG-2023]MDO6664243.1 SoxR reducing system RseC family protein [Colwellia sp. 2_MG-2023]